MLGLRGAVLNLTDIVHWPLAKEFLFFFWFVNVFGLCFHYNKLESN